MTDTRIHHRAVMDLEDDFICRVLDEQVYDCLNQLLADLEPGKSNVGSATISGKLNCGLRDVNGSLYRLLKRNKIETLDCKEGYPVYFTKEHNWN